MGSQSLAVIHAEPKIAWQKDFAPKMVQGLKAIGIDARITSDRSRSSKGFPVLLGTTCWRQLEHDRYLLVDRCSFGNTDEYVSLVWNGHGLRGDHKVPESFDASRWGKHGVELKPFLRGPRIVLCGQHEPYSPHWDNLEDWYQTETLATHFRPHPAVGTNPTKLPKAHNWANCQLAITLNSSVAVDAVINGVDVIARDEGSMVWDYQGTFRTTRLEFFHWLSWTQWHHDEIAAGTPIAHLFS